ncbi:PepSY domain-containing protein [Ruoffia tabacinasalis]|uniref:PepSY domain-containing protein n=1 Tax=Ruoffia tabacinasalis TaxID=87458 RepID=UPI0030D35296
MTHGLETQLGIIPVAEAINQFQVTFPKSDMTKLQIEYEGPFIKYEMVGNDGSYRNTLEINAQNSTVLKERQKPLKTKHQDPRRRQRKALNLNNLLPLSQINDIALSQTQVNQPFQWELDRQKERTVWKVEIADATGSQITEVKVDAQDGTIAQMKLKR